MSLKLYVYNYKCIIIGNGCYETERSVVLISRVSMRTRNFKPIVVYQLRRDGTRKKKLKYLLTVKSEQEDINRFTRDKGDKTSEICEATIDRNG